MISAAFVLAGKAIFTVEVPADFVAKHNVKPHYTYRIDRSEPTERYPTPAMFASLLTGPDNTSDFTYLGKMNEDNGMVYTTHASSMDKSAFPVVLLNKVLARIFAEQGEMIEQTGFKVHHIGRCGRCLRPLTVPASVESGFGPECIKKL